MKPDAKPIYLNARHLLSEGAPVEALSAFIEARHRDPASEKIASWGLKAAYRAGGLAAGGFAVSVAASFPDHLRLLESARRLTRDRPGDAADVALRIAQLRGSDAEAWARAAAALRRASRVAEANDAQVEATALRSQALPPSLADGLDALRCADLPAVPRARLDWAWSLRETATVDGARPPPEWDRAFRWSYASVRLLRDWIEAAPERIDEYAALVDLDGEDRLSAAVRGGRGVLLATAHLGPKYGALPALHRLGLPWRWVASTHPDMQNPLGGMLLSTLPMPGWSPAAAVHDALASGHIVHFPLDSAQAPRHRRWPLEGQSITVNTFGPFAVYRNRCAALWIGVRWEAGRIRCTVAPMPEPRPDEALDPYIDRWSGAYVGLIRDGLRFGPESLRGSGGFWDAIR